MLCFAGGKKYVYIQKCTVSDYFLGLFFNPPYLSFFSFLFLFYLLLVLSDLKGILRHIFFLLCSISQKGFTEHIVHDSFFIP